MMMSSSSPYQQSVSWRQAWPFLAVPLALYCLLLVYPLLQVLWLSVWDGRDNVYAPSFVGLANYQRLWQHPTFVKSLGNSLAFLVTLLPCLLVLPTLVAYHAYKAPSQSLSTIVRAIVYLPVLVPMVVSALLWQWLLQGDGLINTLLKQVGIASVPWLTSVQWVIPAISLVIVWKALGYYMMMVFSHLVTLPTEQDEAALLEGASAWQRFYYITLPQLRGILTTVAIVATMGTIKLFSEVYVLTRGGPLHTSDTLLLFIYTQAFSWLDFGLASAAGVVFAVLLITLTLLQYRLQGKRPLA
ncbi:MAG: carbohydrate ABC transporter permease [Vampirovibrionales bacterium]